MCTDYQSLNSNTLSDSWPLPRIDEMLAQLKGAQLFSKLDLNWYIKEKKCALFLPKVEFLGHMVSAEGVEVTFDKVDAVSSWPMPTCVQEVQSFLGLANFYRRFVKGFAAIAKPLTDLTKKDRDFTWGTEEEAAF